VAEIAFVHNRTGRRYRVVAFDKDAGKVRLIGEHNVEFSEPYSKERFAEMGYTLEAQS
jgi:hypothetical protein